MHKLSASALNTFLKSPRQFYYQYVLRLEPLSPSISTFDHDKVFGSLWSEYIDRFYKGISEKENSELTMKLWLDKTEGWVPDKIRDVKTKAFEELMPQYYQMFSPDDGCRTAEKSELWIENDRFCGRLDGISDEGIIHEVKSTSRSPNLTEQLWKVAHSTQVKLYCVIMDAKGYCIEFGFKDKPFQVFRGPVETVTAEQKQGWEKGLNSLADYIYSLGDDINNYPCSPDGCCLTTKYMVSMCPFAALCDGVEGAEIAFKKREHRS